MDNNLFQRLKELIENNQTIGIMVAPNPSFDGLAAGLGLYLSLKQMNKNVSIVCPTDPTVGVSSLVGIDKLQKSFSGVGGDLVVSFPYKEGEIEKVSYDVDGGKLRIVVKAGAQGLSFNQSDVNFQQGGAAPSLVFFIGVADMGQVGFTKTPGTTIVNIDNKSTNTKYGDVVHVNEKFTSLSEEVADFLTLLEPQIELDVDTSQNLLSGILAATNDFENGAGSYLAFEMAGILMKKGAIRSASGSVARPTSTQMPTNNYFPPQQQAPVAQPVAPMMQPVQQPQQVFQPAAPVQQPVQEQRVEQPQQVYQPMQQQGTMQSPAAPVQQAPVQNIQNDQPPADWLAPKVYKGSSVV
ncbi:MAG TPA: hypothetical protein VEW42_00750 [Candidatus Eisenbacteria bacterium]|nr:hypothetical protein [Candidatus Eisenbacteria bacterium]